MKIHSTFWKDNLKFPKNNSGYPFVKRKIKTSDDIPKHGDYLFSLSGTSCNNITKGKVLALIKAKHRNGKPVFLVGFSRGSVDAGRFAKTYPEDVNGIVLASGIYTNSSKKAQDYAMESIIGTRISTAVLIVHHRDDSCRVTPFGYAERFYERLTAPMKDLLDYSGGGSSGRECGPLNHHGFEGLESRVAIDISKWILELAGHP